MSIFIFSGRKKIFQAKPFQYQNRPPHLEKCVCLYGICFGAFSVHIFSAETKFVFCFLDNLHREKTNSIRMLFVLVCSRYNLAR